MSGLISRAELKAKLDRGDLFVLVDTLPEPAYRASRLPGAIQAVAEKGLPQRRCMKATSAAGAQESLFADVPV